MGSFCLQNFVLNTQIGPFRSNYKIHCYALLLHQYFFKKKCGRLCLEEEYSFETMHVRMRVVQ